MHAYYSQEEIKGALWSCYNDMMKPFGKKTCFTVEIVMQYVDFQHRS